MTAAEKPGDPADRVADGAFGGVHSHRAGYGGNILDGRVYTREEWIERGARQGGTMAAGEGKVLVKELDRLRAILAALREPRAEVVKAAARMWRDAECGTDVTAEVVRAAVAAAEQEVEL